MNDSSLLVLRGVCRGLHLAGYFSVFGSLFFAAVVLRGETVPGLRLLVRAGAGLALLAGLAWFALQTLYFAGAQNAAEALGAAPAVALHTVFGRLLLARFALLLAALVLQERQCRSPAALAAGCGVLAQAWLGHGGAMVGQIGDVLLAAALLHIAAAALWLGSLPALFAALARAPHPMAIARRYAILGKSCVAALLVTALVQYAVLIGRPAALLETGYGMLVLAKTLLLAGLIVLAARNHLRLTPGLPATRPALLRAIGAELALGLLILLAAGVLLQLAPPAMAAMAPPQG